MTLTFQPQGHYEATQRFEFLRQAACAQSFNGIGGDYAEFGCWSATTFRMAYACLRRYRHAARLWAFDSFEGLPAQTGPEDEHRKWQPGAYRFSVDEFVRACDEQKIPAADYSIVKGFYETTIGDAPAGTAGLPDDICIAYVDCDLYSSTRTVLQFLEPRLKHGMIIALDDYYCWSSAAVAGNRMAMLELAQRCTKFHFAPYLSFGWNGMSFVVESREILGALAPRSPLSH